MVKRNKNKQLNKVIQANSGRVTQMRPKTKIDRMDQEASHVSSRYVYAPHTTAAAAQWVGYFNLAVATNANDDAGAVVLKNYQEYKYKSYRFGFTPAVGTTTAGTLWIGYYDNPEIMYKVLTAAYSDATLLSLAKQSPHSSSAPIWQQQTLNIPMSSRRKRYSVNSTAPSSVAETDLQCHGVVIMATEGVPFSTVFGNASYDYSALGYNLQSYALSGI